MNQTDFKSQIQNALPIENYIGRFVALKKQGKYLKGLCPFHSEKTPSFTVTPEKGIYHCFGCGKGGDVITFVMEMDSLTFPEALEVLSAYTGIKKPKSSGKDQKQSLLFDINARASQVFSNFLNEPAASSIYQYIKNRNITDEALKAYYIGGSPDSWNFLTHKMKDSLPMLSELGLVKKGKNDYYDFFRNRLIFPIHDITGHVAGFGGRALPGNDKEAKYINSSESSVFHKGSTLYGLFQSLSSVKQEKEIYIVEGYMDVIGLFQQGIKNTAAPLGTAFTEEHLKILQRYTDKIILVMDGDQAGKKAALRACQILMKSPSIKTSVILLPEGRDAFDLASFENKETVRSVLENRIPSSRFLIYETLFPGWTENKIKTDNFKEFTAEIKKIYDINPSQSIQPDLEEKRNALERLFQFVSGIQTPLEQEIFLNEGAISLGLDPASVRSEMKKKNDMKPASGSTGKNTVNFHEQQDDPAVKKLIRIEREILTELIFSSHLMNLALEAMDQIFFFDEYSEILWRYLEGRYTTGNLWNSDDFVKFEIPRELISVFSGELISQTEKNIQERDESIILRQLINKHEEIRIKKEIKELEIRLPVADSVEQEVLLSSYNSLLKDLKERENLGRNIFDKTKQ
ncbi:MAG: DNA primase [Spirochaetia bacterium]|nr:DNA primase [Spirochaetia bacterium]